MLNWATILFHCVYECWYQFWYTLIWCLYGWCVCVCAIAFGSFMGLIYPKVINGFDAVFTFTRWKLLSHIKQAEDMRVHFAPDCRSNRKSDEWQTHRTNGRQSGATTSTTSTASTPNKMPWNKNKIFHKLHMKCEEENASKETYNHQPMNMATTEIHVKKTKQRAFASKCTGVLCLRWEWEWSNQVKDIRSDTLNVHAFMCFVSR